MKARYVVIALLLLLAPVVASESSDAESVLDQGTIYVYGDTVKIKSIWASEGKIIESDWTLEELVDGVRVLRLTDTGTEFNFSIAGYDNTLIVTQHVEGGDPDTAVIRLIPMHMSKYDEDGDGKFLVTFWNVDHSEIREILIDMTYPTNLPQVVLPTTPVREGFIFDGWFCDQDYQQPYNPYDPLTGNIDVYAKWVRDAPVPPGPDPPGPEPPGPGPDDPKPPIFGNGRSWQLLGIGVVVGLVSAIALMDRFGLLIYLKKE